MASRFSFSGGRLSNPWFRIGNIEVGSAGAMALAAAATMVAGAFVPQLLSLLALNPFEVRSLQLWRIATWPFAERVGFFPAIQIVVLWFIGTAVEVQIGRRAMSFLLVCLTLMGGLVATLLTIPVVGVRPVELVLLLLFVADNPHAPFFFGISAWILGAFIAVLEFLQLVQARAFEQLVLFLFMLVLGALLGRAVGMLRDFPFIPKLPLPASATGRSRRASRKDNGAPTRNHRGRVVQGPWSSATPPTSATDRAADQAELDGLLDKISADGLDALSNKEKKRLNELSKRLR